jgi:hypothetical protein
VRSYLLTLGVLISAFGCEVQDPLDPDLLQRIARRVGDGSGDVLSGVYPMAATTPLRCECSELDTSVFAEVFDGAPSEAICENVAAWIFLKEIRLDVRQYDGFMSAEDQVPGGVLYFTGARLSLTGATHADRTAELASVINISGDQLQLLSRASLTFAVVDGAPNGASGVLRSRLTSRIPDAAVECDIDFVLNGTANVEDNP